MLCRYTCFVRIVNTRRSFRSGVGADRSSAVSVGAPMCRPRPGSRRNRSRFPALPRWRNTLGLPKHGCSSSTEQRLPGNPAVGLSGRSAWQEAFDGQKIRQTSEAGRPLRVVSVVATGRFDPARSGLAGSGNMPGVEPAGPIAGHCSTADGDAVFPGIGHRPEHVTGTANRNSLVPSEAD